MDISNTIYRRRAAAHPIVRSRYNAARLPCLIDYPLVDMAVILNMECLSTLQCYRF